MNRKCCANDNKREHVQTEIFMYSIQVNLGKNQLRWKDKECLRIIQIRGTCTMYAFCYFPLFLNLVSIGSCACNSTDSS